MTIMSKWCFHYASGEFENIGEDGFRKKSGGF